MSGSFGCFANISGKRVLRSTNIGGNGVLAFSLGININGQHTVFIAWSTIRQKYFPGHDELLVGEHLKIIVI